MPNLQEFEKGAITELDSVYHLAEITYKPLYSMLSDPISILNCDQVKTTSTFQGLGGRWAYIKARAGKPTSTRQYSTKIGPVAIPNSTIYIFKNGSLIDDKQTNSNGNILLDFSTNRPSKDQYAVSLAPELAPMNNPAQDVFGLTIWNVKCKVKNLTDRWWRWAGRNYTNELPRVFWKYPQYTIGLASSMGLQTFIDIVPVFSDQSMTLEYGISAMCNTQDPYPSRDACIAARKNTWWQFIVEASNGHETKTVNGKLNIDRHLRVEFTSDDISGSVVAPEGAET